MAVPGGGVTGGAMLNCSQQRRRGGRVAEGGGLLNRCTVKSCTGGSNPPLSARFQSVFLLRDLASATLPANIIEKISHAAAALVQKGGRGDSFATARLRSNLRPWKRLLARR
jgi:hypothetical protein